LRPASTRTACSGGEALRKDIQTERHDGAALQEDSRHIERIGRLSDMVLAAVTS
jgi:hypothetical protein